MAYGADVTQNPHYTPYDPGKFSPPRFSELGDYLRIKMYGNESYTPSRGSWVKTLFFPAVAGTEDYAACGFSVIYKQPDGYVPPPINEELSIPWPITPEWAMANFSRADKSGGEMIQLSLTTVYEVLSRRPYK